MDLRSDASEQLLGFLLLLQSGFEEIGSLAILKQIGIGPHAAIASHFIMFHPLSSGDQSGILHPIVDVFPDDFVALTHQPFHDLTFLTLRLLSQAFKA